MNFLVTSTLAIIVSAALSVTAQAYTWVWDPTPPMPEGDAQWNKVRLLWQDHAKGKNLPEIIALLNAIKDKDPDKVEASVCLAKAHCLQAWYGSERRQNFEKAEIYAAQACKLAPLNRHAIHALCESLIMNRDRAYIFSRYGDYLKSVSPLKLENAELLPEMKRYADWNTFLPLWQARLDLEKGKAAAELSEKMAQAHPGDVMAQIWAACADYYVGHAYTSMNKHEQGIPYYKRGIAFAQKALQREPQNQPANFWYVLNLSRSIQFTSLVNKGRYLMDLMKPSFLSLKENSGYSYFNIIGVCSTMITNGGWVTERGMAMAGITVDNVRNGLELAEMVYPDFFYTSYCRADLLAYKGRKREARTMLERLMARSPSVNPPRPENIFDQREARMLYDALKEGKR